jgi:hypothetical protein
MATEAPPAPKKALMSALVHRVAEDPVDLMVYLLRFLNRDRCMDEEDVCDLLNCAYQDCEDYPEHYRDAFFFAGNSVMAKGFAKLKLDRFYTFPDFREDLRSDASRFAKRSAYGAETREMIPLVQEVAIHYFSWCSVLIDGFLSDDDAAAMAHLARTRNSRASPFLLGQEEYSPLCLILPRDGKPPVFSMEPTDSYP